MAGVGQVAPRYQSLLRPLTCINTVFDRLSPATEESKFHARLGGTGLVAAGFAQRQDPPRRPVPGDVVTAHRYSTKGGVGRRVDQGRGWAVLEADPQCFQAQPGDRGRVAGEV